MDKRFIEESFPVKEVSEQSAREKHIRKGNISTLHIWWARRPLSSSRATNYAALIPAPKDEIDWVNKRNFIIELSKWENTSNKNIIKKAKQDILDFNEGIPPKVLDPFSGGGAIPLESLRLGCETYANDYNPVAVLIEKCTLEYPVKYGKSENNNWSDSKSSLVTDIKNAGEWVLNETKKDVAKFYPTEKDGYVPIAYIWSRTISCQNPSCGVEIPLFRQNWLAKKKNKKVALKISKEVRKIEFRVVGQDNSIPNDYDPSKGTVKRTVVTCPICGFTIDAKETRKLFIDGLSGEKLIAVVLKHPQKAGKKYRIANNNDTKIFNEVKTFLLEKNKKLLVEWGINPIPEESIPLMSGTFNVPLYGLDTWGSLFNNRQKLVLITFVEKIRNLHKKLIKNGFSEDYAKVIATYLSLNFDKMLSKYNNICRWNNILEKTEYIFSRQALPMMWDYPEINPLSDSAGGWNSYLKFTLDSIDTCLEISNKHIEITNSSSTNLNYSDNYFDAVFTDPPYYNSVPYADLSDFFYVWLKRLLGDLYPKLFSTPLTPKSDEIVEMAGWDRKRYGHKNKEFFEKNLKTVLQEISRVLKTNGVATIVYAHKTTQGWETIINALLDSGLTVTASWPISTEMVGRLRAHKSAALASSIYIIVRKYQKTEIGWFKDVKEEIKEYIPKKINKLWEEGISGADFFIAAIGSAIEIFGKYEKVLDNKGNEIRADKLLSFVRDVVADYTVKQILHNGIADELSPLTKFYLMWRWNYQEVRVPFDDARKLAQSAGIDLSKEWNKGFIIKRGEFITLLGPNKRDKKSLKDSLELIDILHYACILWKEGKKDEMKSILKKSGYGKTESMYQVAQAISECLPNNSSEKKMIEGFLAFRDKIMQDMREDEPQTKLV